MKWIKNNWILIFLVLLIIFSPYIVGIIVSTPNDILGRFKIDNFNGDSSWIGFFLHL